MRGSNYSVCRPMLTALQTEEKDLRSMTRTTCLLENKTMDNPRIVTICGSMRFYQEMLAHASKLTIEGVIVLMPFVASETGWIKSMLDELHRQKIAMSHAILVVNPGGYIGE